MLESGIESLKINVGDLGFEFYLYAISKEYEVIMAVKFSSFFWLQKI